MWRIVTDRTQHHEVLQICASAISTFFSVSSTFCALSEVALYLVCSESTAEKFHWVASSSSIAGEREKFFPIYLFKIPYIILYTSKKAPYALALPHKGVPAL